MNGKRISPARIVFSLSAVCVSLLLWSSKSADGAGPWTNLLTLNRVEADPDKEYRLSQDNGPWMIMACSFSGEHRDEQARELALELRKRYKVEAYTHRMEFDLDEAEGRGLDEYGDPARMRYRRGNRREETAVLVGNYQAVDDAGAQKTLEKLKYCRPKCLELDPSKPTARTLAGWRLYAKYASPEKQRKGPLKAFITTNPKVPQGYYVPQGLDPLVVEMNEPVEHSLLKCPGKFTVQVATFKGQVFIEPSEIAEIERGKQMKSSLADAAMKAHRLTEALRLKGWEAYEFHDRYASIVTVGSFNSMGTPRADGKVEINPRIHSIMQTFGAQPASGMLVGVTPLKSLVGIPFDVQPIPVQVPKRSIGREMARGR